MSEGYGVESQESITIKLGMDRGVQEADARAIGLTMEAVATMIEEVHQKFNDNHKLVVKARPFSPGSFEIPLDIVMMTAVGVSLFDPNTISHILSIIKDYFSIKNQLKGEIPKIGDGKIIFENNTINADSITINLLDPKSLANQLVSKAFSCVDSDEKIKNMLIIRKTNAEEIARVPKQNFPYYGNIQTKVDAPEDQIKQEKITLIIRSPVLEEDKDVKWKFIKVKDSSKISANIIDENFLAKVKIGENFAAGDSLDVDLQTRMKYDKMYDKYTDPKHTIITVHKHNKKPEQLEINFDEAE